MPESFKNKQDLHEIKPVKTMAQMGRSYLSPLPYYWWFIGGWRENILLWIYGQ